MPQPSPETAPPYCPFYAVPGGKFVVMSICTMGLYQFYWLYRNWMAVKVREGTKIRPLWRAYFAPLFLYQLVRRVRDMSDAAGVVGRLHPVGLLLLYLLSVPFAYADSPLFLTGYISIIPLYIVNRAIRRLHAHYGLSNGHDRYSARDWIWLVLGPVILLMGVAAYL